MWGLVQSSMICELCQNWLGLLALARVAMLVLPKFSTFGLQKCYLRRRIWSKTLAGRSQKCYFGEGIGHFQAQKSVIFGETFAGASQGLSWHCIREKMHWPFEMQISASPCPVRTTMLPLVLQHPFHCDWHLTWQHCDSVTYLGTILPAFAECLAMLPNFHTIQVVHVHSQMTIPLKNTFKGKSFPSICTVIVPSCVHEILQCCLAVEDLTSNEGDGSTLIGALVAAKCNNLRTLQGILMNLAKAKTSKCYSFLLTIIL